MALTIFRNRRTQGSDTDTASGPTGAALMAREADHGVIETTICQLEPNECGTVVRIQGEPSLRNHLLEMGFTRGTIIEFQRRAPLGDPIDVKLRGYRLSLREREACAVVVSVKRPLAAGSRGARGK